MTDDRLNLLSEPLELKCGLRLKNRLVKAPMSDSLGDGTGNPTDEQIELNRRWHDGGAALSLVGEVQVDRRYPEKPGNLALDAVDDETMFRRLATVPDGSGAHIWPQLGHAGALSYPPVSTPVGPSALDLEGLQCPEMSTDELEALPGRFAVAATNACRVGFTGVQIHAAHGFLLSQFLSPLFNRRVDRYGGSIEARAGLLIAVVDEVRRAVGPDVAVAVKINATDELEGGLTEADALVAVEMVDRHGVDLIEISGGTYFPGAPSSSDRGSTSGPYYSHFANKARFVTGAALMVTGGVKTRSHAVELRSGGADLVGLARTMVLDPELPKAWLGAGGDPTFPSFPSTVPGGVTAWYTMRLEAIAQGHEAAFQATPQEALATYDRRDESRVERWRARTHKQAHD